MLIKCVNTFSGVYTGYIIEHGIQVVLFTTTNVEQVEDLCKAYSVTYKKIYVEHVFTKHTTFKFKF